MRPDASAENFDRTSRTFPKPKTRRAGPLIWLAAWPIRPQKLHLHVPTIRWQTLDNGSAGLPASI